MPDKAKFIYYKESGKYYTSGEGIAPCWTDPEWVRCDPNAKSRRDLICSLNGGTMPGLNGRGSDFFISVYDATEESNAATFLIHPE